MDESCSKLMVGDKLILQISGKDQDVLELAWSNETNCSKPRAANTCRQGQRDFGEANGRAKQQAGRGHDFTAAGWWHSVCKFRRQRRHEAVVESAEFLLRPPFCSSAGQLESFQKSFL